MAKNSNKNKKKITFVAIAAVLTLALVAAAIVVGVNWDSLKSAVVDGTQLYTYEQLEAAKKEGFEEAKTNEKELLERINKLNQAVIEKDAEAKEAKDELAEFKNSVNDLLDDERQKGYNNGYNSGYEDGVTSGTIEVPQDCCVVIFNPNIPENCSSVLEGVMTSEILPSKNATLSSNNYLLEHYTFAGWNSAADGSGTNYSDGQLIEELNGESIVLYAQWVPDKGTVIFDANGGNCTVTSKQILFDATYGALPTPTRSGYFFRGWFTAATGGTKVAESTKVENIETHTLYAQWVENGSGGVTEFSN